MEHEGQHGPFQGHAVRCGYAALFRHRK
jgi:hypothetical protein